MASALEQQAFAALGQVLDPELDEPITDLGFVRSLEADSGSITVHLRLPTSFCSPNFAYLMASDAKDARRALPQPREVVVLLDDAEITCVPVADGGDGTTDAALSISFERHTCRVTGPFGRPTEAVYAYDPGRGTAVLEVAEACGLGLIPASEVGTETADGKDASSSGVGT